ncbi:DUF4288 domain-containing protein [Streptomyces candidus]|uniref:DUF4288 domain-containing protein n=1 Tax=Streptomyces candidus TaxID=67283 RepID=A0A7X0HCS9_9ACTN|nr:DUF4288 domain-containing protein [Streptomyces candidus]MBB6435131.1 hypothetical protein [Streptomyces candidus]GHH40749.1 hypothetical protein GCM10018773_22370 [Streptomyces candidus]
MPSSEEDVTGAPYIAIVLMESSSDSAEYVPLYQEDIVLIHARDEDAARHAAEQRARRSESSFLNEDGQKITWRLKTIVDVQEAQDTDLTQDADLYSRHFRDYVAYEKFEPLLSGEEL